jgi:hypothetical protein
MCDIEQKDTEVSKSCSSASDPSENDPTEPTTNEEQSMQLQQLYREMGQQPAQDHQEAETPSDAHSAQASSVSGQDTLDAVDEIAHTPESGRPLRVDTEIGRSIASTSARTQNLALGGFLKFFKIARDKSLEEVRDYQYGSYRKLSAVYVGIIYFLILFWYHVALGTGRITSAVTDNPLKSNP